MKKYTLITVLIILVSCSNTLKKKYSNQNSKEDLIELKTILNSEDFDLLENTIIRLSFNTQEIEKFTYQEILEKGKDLKNSEKKAKNKIIQEVNFEEEKRKRYTKTIEKLKIIRDAQVKYYELNGIYSNDKKRLINFIEKSKLAITIVKEHNGKRVIDTIGYEPVLKYFENRDYKNMWKVQGKEFELKTGVVEKIAGLKIPVFITRIEKELILEGLKKELVEKEKKGYSNYEIKGEYISVGSLNEITTGGNWPPSYDKTE